MSKFPIKNEVYDEYILLSRKKLKQVNLKHRKRKEGLKDVKTWLVAQSRGRAKETGKYLLMN
jgi:hypothetical protein